MASQQIYNLNFHGCSPSILHFKAGDSESSHSPFLERQPNQEVYLDGCLISEPLHQNQMIRRVQVDRGPSKFYICDDSFSGVFRKACPYSIHQLASGLQKLFLLRISDQEEILHTKLQAAERDTKEYLLEMIRNFAGNKEEIKSDLEKRTGSRRQFLSVVLSYLQYGPAIVRIDETGSISPQGRKCESRHHVFIIEENGIYFDFSASQAEQSRLFVRWEDVKHLWNLGIYFYAEQLEGIPLSTWFGPSPGNTGQIEAAISDMVISAKVSQSQEQNVNMAEGSLTTEDVESTFEEVQFLTDNTQPQD